MLAAKQYMYVCICKEVKYSKKGFKAKIEMWKRYKFRYAIQQNKVTKSGVLETNKNQIIYNGTKHFYYFSGAKAAF